MRRIYLRCNTSIRCEYTCESLFKPEYCYRTWSGVDNPTDTFYQEYRSHLDRKSIVQDRIGNVSFASSIAVITSIFIARRSYAYERTVAEESTACQLLSRQISRSAFSDYPPADFTFPLLFFESLHGRASERNPTLLISRTLIRLNIEVRVSVVRYAKCGRLIASCSVRINYYYLYI